MDNIDSCLYIEDGRLHDYAASAAKLLRPQDNCAGAEAAALLRRNFGEIRRCHQAVERRYGSLAAPPSACEWLLDNWYMVQREYLSAVLELRKARRLRCCSEGIVITELCRVLVRSGLGKVTEERCGIFLSGFQSVTVLQRRELDLFPAALRCAIIEAIADVCRKMQYAADTTAHAQALSALFTSLRLFSVLDLEKLLGEADVSGSILSQDPTGDYERMDSSTQREYLLRLEHMARRSGLEEHMLARKLIKQAQQDGRHIGFYLFKKPAAIWSWLYIGLVILLPLSISLLIAFYLDSIAAALLLLVPVWELIKSFMDFLLLHLISPRPLPRIDTSHGIPSEGKSLCVVSTLLGPGQAERLEQLRLACRSAGKDLMFGLLADLPASKSPSTQEDAQLLRQTRRTIRQLNRKYGGGFYLFTRERSFDGEQYSGRERKRGALLELSRLLCGQPSALEVTGDLEALSGTKYIVTLDSDTQVYPGSVGELIGAAIHPLNRAVIDHRRHVVKEGYGLIHPRMSTGLQSANATDFALIFAGAGGSDPYGALCGELYMDAFDNGGFAGKGVIDAAALLECTGSRFPQGCILSHDALEGAYLHGAYMGDVEFSDNFPTRPLAYYKRLHRWIRGDWQNAPWIFKRELRAMDRFRLFDSLRRSLFAPMTFLAILSGFMLPESALALSAAAALLALLTNLLLSFAQSGLARRERVRLRRHTRLLTGIGGSIVQTFIRLWLLPYEAWVCLTAIVTALWRMLISRKRLLQWQTAAQVEKGSHDFAQHIKKMWFPIVLGVLLMAFSPAIIGKASGFMWLLSPAAAAALALPAYKESCLRSIDRDYLIRAAGENLRYLLDFFREEDNFLPPDNFQEQPPVGTAHRTSPTNMGLAMAAVECGVRMGLIDTEKAAEYLSHMADTMERMPRCMGHFYNWYDTRSLRPLSPRYISTVDSGNLYAGLLCVSQALESQGRWELKERIDALMAPMDFSPLYDSGRGLFYICYDSENERGAGGWYDLMASEAMLTSYLAIAKGDVPIKHWRRLSRAQLQKDGYRGLASWTGTMFEYLMPELFLPVYRSSLLYESSRFCLYAQRRRCLPGRPWGISESAFYSLDASLSYRYKAHGCPALALKRGQEADMVISPYSSFLALAVEPEAAVKNLRRLESWGARGRYGFMEALDFTPSRCRGKVEKVSCYMAHHVSMSIIAAANAVCRGYAQELFMSDSSMAAYALLLQERLPAEAVVIRRALTEVPEKPRRGISQRWQLRGGAEDREMRACLLSNGAYNIMSTNHGHTSAFLGETCIYHSDSLTGGVNISLDGKPLFPAESPLMWELGEAQCSCSRELGGISANMSVSAATGDIGELRCLELQGSQRRQVRLELSFQPILAELSHWEDHPAYWKLGITAEQEGQALLLHRLPKDSGRGLWLCLLCSDEAEYQGDAKGGLGSLSQPLVRVGVKLLLDEGKSCSVRFALCVAAFREEALAAAQRILYSDKGAQASMAGAAAVHLGMSPEEVGAAMSMVLPLWQNRLYRSAPRLDLWQYGVSGDLPIICCQGDSPESEKLLRRFCLLKSCGLNADLIFFSDQQGEYQQPLLGRIVSVLSPVGLEALIGSPGGVHILPSSAETAVRSRAAFIAGEKRKLPPALSFPVLSSLRAASTVPPHCWTEQGFEFQVDGVLPPVAWQHVITNGSMGYIATDCGIGNMWLENAREMRVNPPGKSVLDVSGSEFICLEYKGKPVSLFAAGDAYPCRVFYAPGYAVWEKRLGERKIKATLFIPVGTNVRVLLIDGAEGLSIRWGLELCLGSRSGACVTGYVKEDIAHFENPESYFPGAEFLAAFSGKGEFSVEHCPVALSLRGICENRSLLICGFCSEDELRELFSPGHAVAALAGVCARWEDLLGHFSLRSPCSPLDHYMSRWAVYQCLACRLEGRSSLYQSGGALGFRDQLQDSVNLMLIDPAYAREQILLCCRHQYLEGDVMHWWHSHPQGDKGVRTRCSDDLLWLVWALCEYTDATGDYALCNEETPYLASSPLASHEWDRYETPEVSSSAPVLLHAKGALECCISRGFGPHGLPRMLGGDWNDALNAVEGESVWLGWFFSHCARRFAALLEKLGVEGSQRYSAGARQIGAAAEASWNGQWYTRAYYADGEALGGPERIDSLAQSWAALSPYVSPLHADKALDTALERLIDRQNKLVKLFDPPYSCRERRPGYISGYGEGFRENGGQYTHGAIWLALAALRRGRVDEGYEILQYLLPENHDLKRYGAEPFVLPADVYSAPGHEGEAGWSWYTGSAGWYFRVVTEELLGLRLREGKLYIEPNLPAALPSYSVTWIDRQSHLHRIDCDRGRVYVDGDPYLGQGIG